MWGTKFRAWDGTNIIDDVTVVANSVNNFFPNPAIAIFARNGEFEEVMPVECIECSTGFVDKNGEEIYEGDILMDDCGDPLEYWTVKHEYGKFVGETQGVVEDVYELTDLEVIGNIHENPELLKEKE